MSFPRKRESRFDECFVWIPSQAGNDMKMLTFDFMSKRILISPNAFKHSLSAIEVAKTVKLALDQFDLKCELSPIADGGDGTIDVLNFSFPSSKFIKTKVHDPLMREIESSWILWDKDTAVIELAKTSGITLLKQNELNPMWANTFGTGELILSALDKGCRKIIIALGGSATIDAGVGILEALGGRFEDKKRNKVKPGAGFLNLIEKINWGHLDKRIKDCEIHILCDVQSHLVGKKGIVNFSAQKGASPGELVVIETNMNHYAEVVKKTIGAEFRFEPMTGAAGGVAFSLKAFLGAKLFSGFAYIANLISLEEKIKKSNLVITGEGNLDSQSLMGKGVIELAKLAKKYSKKAIVLCGDYDECINWKEHYIEHVIKIKPENLSLEESLKNTQQLIVDTIKQNVQLFINS